MKVYVIVGKENEWPWDVIPKGVVSSEEFAIEYVKKKMKEGYDESDWYELELDGVIEE